MCVCVVFLMYKNYQPTITQKYKNKKNFTTAKLFLEMQNMY